MLGDVTVAVAARARAERRSGQLPVPPGARVDRAPAAQPSAAAPGRPRPWSRPAISPALKQSPAPVASTGTRGGTLTRCRRAPSAHSAPRAPSLTTSRDPAAVSTGTAAARSGSPLRRTASASLGSSRSARASAAASRVAPAPPPGRIPVGVQGHGGPGRLRGRHHGGQAGPERVLEQEVGADVHVPRPAEQRGRDVGGGQRAHRPEGGQDGPVTAVRQGHGHPGRAVAADRHGVRRHPLRGQLAEHELARRVVTDRGDQRDAAGRAAPRPPR